MWSNIVAVALLCVTYVSAVTHKVQVGLNGTRTFLPPNLTAVAGDIIAFEFYANHSVTRSSGFDHPCAAYTGNASWVDTGILPANTTYKLKVNNSDTLLAHCKIPGHCGVAGMVFALNLPPNETYSQFKANAVNTTINGAPPTTGTATKSSSNPTETAGKKNASPLRYSVGVSAVSAVAAAGVLGVLAGLAL